jgi:superfamily II DNA or RNA helicase
MALTLASAEPAKLNLLPHQQGVIDYLNQHPAPHGLVLYHALGAGKTITSLSYAQQQKLKTIVLVPEVLKAHWFKEIKKVGLPEKSIELLAYNNKDDIKKIKATDFSNTLVIVDEIQKFIELVRVAPDQTHIEIYWQLNKVGKILLLTGTPVFNDAADVAFIGNLVAGKETFPFHKAQFKAKYMQVNTSTSLFRGYFTESKLITSTLPLYATFLGASLIIVSGSIWAFPIITMAGTTGLNYVNEAYPIAKVNFREFDARLFSPFSHEYISFYEAAENDKKDYPKAEIHEKKVHYTEAQTRYFLKFIDGVLEKDELALLVKDYPYLSYSDAMFHTNSAKIQQDILARPDAGREIGNFSLPGKNGVEISTKFIEIERLIRANPGKTAVYSSYYYNGIVLLADFLKQKGHSVEILRPDVGVDEITRILDNFNTGKNKILLIDPEITEGISLVGVEQMHLLEPVKNVALEKQIIGRSVRYGSHLHLPENRRKVDVYLWESEVVYSRLGWPTDAGLVRREQWREHYREVNPSLWTNGIAQLDTEYFKKDETPDFRTSRFKNQIASDMESFRRVSLAHSIEKEASTENKMTLSSQLSSPFAVPMLYFNFTQQRPYTLFSLKDGKPVLKMLERQGVDFDIEIPHNNHLNVGFALRMSKGKVQPVEAGFVGERITQPIGTFDMDLGLLTRLHYEPSNDGKLSFYWKNEIDAGIYAFLPAWGVNLGLRESLGAQVLFTKHLGLAVEVGYEGKILKDTVLSESDAKDNDMTHALTGDIIKRMSSMRYASPFVSVGLFSTYF